VTLSNSWRDFNTSLQDTCYASISLVSFMLSFPVLGTDQVQHRSSYLVNKNYTQWNMWWDFTRVRISKNRYVWQEIFYSCENEVCRNTDNDDTQHLTFKPGNVYSRSALKNAINTNDVARAQIKRKSIKFSTHIYPVSYFWNHLQTF